VTDPFLLSPGDDDEPGPADRIGELARRMGVPCSVFQYQPPEVLNHLEAGITQREADWQRWGDLASSVADTLTAAGFRQHHPDGPRGGYCLSVREDGVLAAWSVSDYADDMITPFEKAVDSVMGPALEQILQATGFTVRIIPDPEDDAGNILVTGMHEPGPE
jgi:hypothetical protein